MEKEENGGGGGKCRSRVVLSGVCVTVRKEVCVRVRN